MKLIKKVIKIINKFNNFNLKNVDLFNKYLENIYFTFLKDKTYAVTELRLKKLKVKIIN